MTAINHSLAGLVLSKILPIELAVPAAFVSHFLLDMLPHYGEVFEKRKKLTRFVWVFDALLFVSLIIKLALDANWTGLACVLVAISPDIVWVYRFVFKEKFGKMKPCVKKGFNKFHASIQKFESRKGLIVEVIWLVSMTVIYNYGF